MVREGEGPYSTAGSGGRGEGGGLERGKVLTAPRGAGGGEGGGVVREGEGPYSTAGSGGRGEGGGLERGKVLTAPRGAGGGEGGGVVRVGGRQREWGVDSEGQEAPETLYYRDDALL